MAAGASAGRASVKHPGQRLAWSGQQAKLILVQSRAGRWGAAVGRTGLRPQRAEHHVRGDTEQVCHPGGWQLSLSPEGPRWPASAWHGRLRGPSSRISSS